MSDFFQNLKKYTYLYTVYNEQLQNVKKHIEWVSKVNNIIFKCPPPLGYSLLYFEPNDDLTRIYSVLVLDYVAVVNHTQLTQEQTNDLERLQAFNLKIIYGFRLSYREALSQSGLDTLWRRREKLLQKFIEKTSNIDRFRQRWFPRKTFTHMNLRKELFYEEKHARTERLYRSPLYSMRRRLYGGQS